MTQPSFASSHHLSTFALDLHYQLEQTELFLRIDIKKTGSPKYALVVACSLADAATTQAKVAETLKQAWNETPPGYKQGKNACEMTTSASELQMRFSTSTNETYVTGLIEVIGFK